MHKFFLWLVRLFNGLWRQLGADPQQLLAILEAKLLYDARRPRQNMGGQQKTSKEWVILLFMLMFGCFFAATLFLFSRNDSALLLYFTVWMVYMIMLLLTDFTEILIDVRDNYIILPQPVNDRTFTLARLLHIVLYLGRIVIAFTFGAQLYFLLRFGVWPWFIFTLLIPLATVLVVFGVNLLYLLLLRVSTPGKFKDIIGYFQIAFTTLLLTGYYILPRLLDFSAMEDKDLLAMPISNLLPPAWLGSLYVLLAEGQTDLPTILRSGLALVVPVIGIYVVIKLSSNFNQKLLAIGRGSSSEEKPSSRKIKTEQSGKKWYQTLGARLTANSTERASFEWVWLMMRRSRDFKVRTYPTFGFIPALFIYFALDQDGDSGNRMQNLLEGSTYIMLLYFCIYAIMVPLTQTNYSERYTAAWIFWANPVEQKGSIQSGRMLAVICGLYLPIYFVTSILVVFLWGFRALPDVFTAGANTLLIGSLISLFEKQLPFSEKMGKTQRGGTFVSILLLLMGAGALGTIHYFLTTSFLHWFVIPLGLISLLLFYLTLRSIRSAT